MTGGHEYEWVNWLSSPYGRLQWSLLRLDSCFEAGDATEALAYGSGPVHSRALDIP